MKRLFLFSTLLLFLLAASSCTHDIEQFTSKAVKGEWQWVYSIGGTAGDSLAPINNTLITLSLNSDSTYEFYLNNEIQVSGNYATKIINNASILYLDHGVQINMLAMQPEQQVFTWDSSQLHLFDYNISDGFNHHFKKIE